MTTAIGSSGVTHPRSRLRLFSSFTGYKVAFVVPDLVAGVTLAAIAIPEQMATARLGSLSPQIGFFAFIAASLAFLVFGASRPMSAGADSTITPIFAGALALAATAGSPHFAALAAGLALMVGLIVGGAGLLRMGWIGNLLSMPVTTGFLAGIAVHIMVSQLPAAMGLAAPAGNTLQRLIALIALAPQAHPAPLVIAGGVLLLITLAHLWSPRIPGPLIAVALASAAVATLHLDRQGVTLLGSVSGGLPSVSFPMPAFADFRTLVPLAFLVSLVVMVQTAATARSFPPPGETPDENGDYVGMGFANIAAGLLGAFPVDASPPRTAIVAESGGRSQLASLTAVAVIVALLLFGMSILSPDPPGGFGRRAAVRRPAHRSRRRYAGGAHGQPGRGGAHRRHGFGHHRPAYRKRRGGGDRSGAVAKRLVVGSHPRSADAQGQRHYGLVAHRLGGAG